MQHEAILILNTTSVRDEFNVTVNSDEDMHRLCPITTCMVEAIDNDSNIYYYLKQNAMDALSYWVSFTSYPEEAGRDHVNLQFTDIPRSKSVNTS